MKTRINDQWEFVSHWEDGFLNDMPAEKTVRLPHTVKELPLHNIDPEDYQMISGYRRTIEIPNEKKGKRFFVQFDGAAHIATVYCNRKELITHCNGYTAFKAEITDSIVFGQKNTIAVKLDSTENSSIPPFGFVVDYLTYGGIYRDVWLEEREESFIEDIFVRTPNLITARVAFTINGERTNPVHVRIEDMDGKVIIEKDAKDDETDVMLTSTDVRPWSNESPNLYRCIVTMGNDSAETTFGYRTVSVDENNILINGMSVFLRGLNRHQSYPYVGYAVPEALQREDVRILQEELGLNAVRTSHYPQSQDFIDECDRRGMYVFTEIPGWQHIGDEEWKKQAVKNTEEMVLQYRNHPSVILWGVRINESTDDDDFYRETNKVAHALDGTRPTTGVRYFEQSHLLEDVYSYNDFSHNGTNAGAKSKKEVTPDMKKPLLISEANGHMFPTKSFDTWQKREEHALRHARVLNAAMKDKEHAGCFQWCMFDYATHKQFGSGDKICYHGVMDSFRNPKMAAAVYAAQSEDIPVLEISSPMDIGDYPGGTVAEIYAFTNADEVRMYKGDDYVASFTESEMKAMNHGPIKIDDFIGDLLKTKEGFSGKKEEYVHESMRAAAKYGINDLPIKYKMMLAWCMMHYQMKYEDGVALYGKYVGGWGGDSGSWKFEAWKDGKCVKTVIKAPSAKVHLETRVSHTELKDTDSYDMAAIRMRILDQNENLAPYSQLVIRMSCEGPIEIVGPAVIAAEGGMAGTYIRTTGSAGKAVLKLQSDDFEDVTIQFDVRKG